MIRDDQHVLVDLAGESPGSLVQDAIDVGHAALQAPLVPLGPTEVVDVVGRHEDDEEQVGIELLAAARASSRPSAGRPPDEVEVDTPPRVDWERMVELERAEPPAELLGKLARLAHRFVARRGVQARDARIRPPLARAR